MSTSAIIKNICYDPDTGRLILSDSENNHFLCDIYGKKITTFIPFITGIQSGSSRKKLAPLSFPAVVSPPKNKYIEYFPITRKFEGYSQFPRPLAPCFCNIPTYEITNKGKKELIEQLRKYFSDEKMKDYFLKDNNSIGLSFLTADLNKYDTLKEDSKALLDLIDNTYEEYKKKYKQKLNILDKNPVIRALTAFKKVLLANPSMKIINGRRFKQPCEGIQSKFYMVNNIIDHKGLRNLNHNTELNSPRETKPKFLYKSQSGSYLLSPTRRKFGIYSYEDAKLEEQELKNQAKMMNDKQEEEKNSLQPPEQVSNRSIDDGIINNSKDKENQFLPMTTNEKLNLNLEINKNSEKDILNYSQSENLSFISVNTKAERQKDEEIKKKKREDYLKSLHIGYLNGFHHEKKHIEGMVIRKYQLPELKTNGELFLENLRLLKLSNPVAFKRQDDKDKYDLKQLEKKRNQTRINMRNAGLKDFVKEEDKDKGK